MPRSRLPFPNVRSGVRLHQKPHNCGHARVDFATVKADALSLVPALVKRWLPDGRQQAAEWVARNPRRNDRTPGSFKVNLRTGRWADFATGDKGGDIISLAAYLFDLSQLGAAQRIANMLGVNVEEARRG